MAMGVILYFVYVNIPFLAPTKPFVAHAIDIVQPVLIFLMLFLTFCKINVHDLKLCAWHWRLLLIQGASFLLLGLLLVIFPDFSARILVEGAMICLICPTATAAAVVTRKLGGDAAHLTTYTILVNLLAAILVPLVLPLVHPHPELNFGSSFALILGGVPLIALSVPSSHFTAGFASESTCQVRTVS